MFDIDITNLPTPCYLVDEQQLIHNLEVLSNVQESAGCSILLAQKGFSMHAVYPLIGKYLKGTCASSLFEAKLGHEELGGETHIFSTAYYEADFDAIMDICGHIVFNSFAQWERFKPRIKASGKEISCGMRINPEYSEIEVDIYNPCFKYSRLGVTWANFRPNEMDGIEGLHFHTMCEQNSDTLVRTLEVFERNFCAFLPEMKWVNFGGGHHITRPDYDIDTLIESIGTFKEKYNVEVYLEPGEAIALDTGFLVSTVLDIVENGMNIAIMDASAACHMPDVLEMPYHPSIVNAGSPGERMYTYRLGGPTCLAGDIIGDYSFDRPLRPGDRLVFRDMAHYTMVKNNTFNGINLPTIALYSESGGIKIIKQFGYEDFKSRLS